MKTFIAISFKNRKKTFQIIILLWKTDYIVTFITKLLLYAGANETNGSVQFNLTKFKIG